MDNGLEVMNNSGADDVAGVLIGFDRKITKLVVKRNGNTERLIDKQNFHRCSCVLLGNGELGKIILLARPLAALG